MAMLLLICAIAFALRLGPLFDNRFHPDEALFSTWALKIAHGENLLLTGVPVDKPPLLIYLSALSFFVFGQSELAARVPNLMASVISVVLVWRLGVGISGHGKLAGDQPDDESAINQSTNHQFTDYQFTNYQFTDLLPPLLLALSPFAILFSPTAFLDPLMIMLGLASWVAASRGRAGWAGVLLGLAFATKVQGLFFLPLIPVFWQRPEDKDASFVSAPFRRSAVRFFIGLAVVVASVLLWDRARGGLPFWVQQTINYGDIRLIYPGESIPRLTGWLDFLPYFFGPIVGVLGLLTVPILLYRTVRSDVWLVIYSIGFLVFHWLFNFPVWDRYLLILVPLAAILFGRSLGALAGLIHRFISPPVFLGLIALAILPFSLRAAQSGYPIGGDHGANDGIDRLAVYLKGLPSGTVVYEHELEWLLGYYMGDGFAYLAYYDTPAAITDDLRVFGSNADRYVIFPARAAPAEVIDAIGQVGYTLTPVFTTPNRFGQTSFTVYQIVKRGT